MEERDLEVCSTISDRKQQRDLLHSKQVCSTVEQRRSSNRIRNRLQACSTIRSCSSEPLLNPKRKSPIHQMESADSCSENTLKKQKTTHAAHKILMDDIIIDILRRLPPKSLGRFKCSSKKWYNFISNDLHFRHYYVQVFGRTTLYVGLFCQSRGKVCFLPTPGNEKILTDNAFEDIGIFSDDEPIRFINDNISLRFSIDGCENLYIIAESNGFLLCSPEFCPLNYFIFNPITKEKVHVPYPNMTDSDAVTGFICERNIDGTLQYKVVRAVSPEDPAKGTNNLMIEFICSNEQKELNLTCSTLFVLNPWNHFPSIISEDGVMYWSAITEYTYLFAALIYDPRKSDSSQLEIIELPGKAGKGYREPYSFVDPLISRLGRVNGLIVNALCYVQHNDHHLEMWELDEVKKEWTLRYRVNQLSIQPRSLCGLHPSDPDLILISLIGEKKAWYNVESKTTEVVITLNKKPSYLHVIQPYVYPAVALLFSTGHRRPLQ